ncbi:MAG: glycosyltransferase [Oscillatoria sp. SIO1A7]|nr:glycosyltransferase [Oscillatoria sp. SIO1A7]
MIKVLFIISGLRTGGAEMMLHQILSRINRSKFQPSVISLGDRGTFGDRIEALDIPVETLNFKLGLSAPLGPYSLVKLIQKIKPDLIQGWMYHGNLASQMYNFVDKNIPIILGIHNTIYSINNTKKLTAGVIKLSGYLSYRSRFTIFVSQVSKSQHQELGYSDKNAVVVPNGVDIFKFKPDPNARISVRSELGISERCIIIGKIARFHPQKDHKNFLEAAKLLCEQYQNVRFLLCGTGVNSENTALQELVDRLGLSKKVSLLGERADIARLIAALDIATLSSAYGEAFPLVVAEAMAGGVPCAVTDVGDCGWIVGNTGRVVEPRQPQALADAWNNLINLPVLERKSLGQAGRERVQKLFSLESVVKQYESLYEKVLGYSKK